MEYRKQVYERLAEVASDLKGDWAVCHGIEGYPDSVGRDLDVICKNGKTEKKLLSLFIAVASKDPRTLAIKKMPSLWGRRVIAVSDNFDVAEVHCMAGGSLRYGLVSMKPDYTQNSYKYLFPVNSEAAQYKALMKLAKNNPSKALEDTFLSYKSIEGLISWVKGGVWVRFLFVLKNPLCALRNFFIGLYRNIAFVFLPVVKKCLLDPDVNPAQFERYVEENLKGLFFDVTDADTIGFTERMRRRARHQLVYYTKKNMRNSVLINNDDLEGKMAGEKLVRAINGKSIG